MAILPDYLAPELCTVFCGTAAGTTSALRGHYYCGRGNEFWRLLHESGLTPERLRSEDDYRVLEFGLGLTDLNKADAQSFDRGLAYDVPTFVGRIAQFAPKWVAFHGKEAAKAASRALGAGRTVSLGAQGWTVADARVFVLPSASGANRTPARLEGRASRADWYRELAELTAPCRRGWALTGSSVVRPRRRQC